MGSEVPFPFRARPSAILVAGMPAGSIACMPLIEEWGVPCRLASRAGFPGCFDGFVTELAQEWLASLEAAQLAEVEIFACGPTPMLQASAALARRLRGALPGVARGVHGLRGGRLRRLHGAGAYAAGAAMKRVCVDGPVFDAYSVF